jgi:D-galactose 1-dehydrogenase
MQRIAIIGLGKIARDRHVAAIRSTPGFALTAAVCPRGGSLDGLPIYATHDEMIAATPQLDAVAICTPPSARYGIARACLDAGLHVLLEKPPGATLGEVAELERLAARRAVTLFTAWHARFNPAVQVAAREMQNERIASMEITWKEDVRKWHPGQQWVWEPGGFGVFDAGINALSIASCILPAELLVSTAMLAFPINRRAPIAARITFSSPCADGPLRAHLDWDWRDKDEWTIDIRSGSGSRVLLSEGGSRLEIDGRHQAMETSTEYSGVYAQFSRLIESGASHVDVTPLRLVADAFMTAQRVEAAMFDW